MAPVHVTKYSGNTETYDESKLRQSLQSAGAPEHQIDETVNRVQGILYDGISTEDIYKEAFKSLRSFSKRSAGRYRLKEALFELGDSEFPFESFIAELLSRLGYETELGVTVLGNCITHDIDVIAQNDDAYLLVECKFCTRDEQRCNVNVPLYVQSRFQDVKQNWSDGTEPAEKIHKAWLVTNSRFTYDAEEYGNCIGLKLLSWDYPRKKGVKDLVDYLNLYPVTCLSTLTKEEKYQILNQDIIFCTQIADDKTCLETAGINPRQINRIAREAEEISR
ncbi:restriction endonuclease [Rhodohalobacter sp. 8-1]|uniref:restriction endonuclease n=1 Tax=Rhodohalobacter sp. 8-1 TaxID=3131972 RepID=UPI0030EE4C93